jgi:hypothetical protein
MMEATRARIFVQDTLSCALWTESSHRLWLGNASLAITRMRSVIQNVVSLDRWKSKSDDLDRFTPLAVSLN